MEEHHSADDHSHYEISLTAGQAFVAFVLLLLSLAASFAFGLMLGKGQADDRLVVRKETPVVTEASLAPAKPSSSGDIVELGVEDDDFQSDEPPAEQTTSDAAPVIAEEAGTAVATESAQQTPEDATSAAVVPAPASPSPAATSHASAPATAQALAPRQHVSTYAQLLSTGDQKTAEALAVKLIDRGFNTAYVERGSTEKGAVYRVRVRFDSEVAARAAEPKLREFSKEVWITTR